MSILLMLFVSPAFADLPKYLSNIPKSHVCEKNAGVLPTELSISAAIRFIADGNKKAAEELTRSGARTTMLARHEELCGESSDIKNAHDYMTRLIEGCELTCRGTADCLRICNTTRDVQLTYLEGVLSGRAACPASGKDSSKKTIR
jgi:hypothetical protein